MPATSQRWSLYNKHKTRLEEMDAKLSFDTLVAYHGQFYIRQILANMALTFKFNLKLNSNLSQMLD